MLKFRLSRYIQAEL